MGGYRQWDKQLYDISAPRIDIPSRTSVLAKLGKRLIKPVNPRLLNAEFHYSKHRLLIEGFHCRGELREYLQKPNKHSGVNRFVRALRHHT